MLVVVVVVTSPVVTSRSLGLLNEALLRQRTDRRFCTVTYASLQVNGGGSAQVCLSSGGHPLPYVLRADGSVEAVGEPGTLLGVLPTSGSATPPSSSRRAM